MKQSKLSMILNGKNAKVSLFVGEKFVTIVSSEGMSKSSLQLNGSGTAQEIASSIEHLSKTKQFRTMRLLGFNPVDEQSSYYVRWNVTVRMHWGKIFEIFVDGKNVDSATIDLEAKP
jgi:hypothetical protein